MGSHSITHLSSYWPNDTTQNEKDIILEFQELVHQFQGDKIKIDDLLNHPISEVLFSFFKNFQFLIVKNTFI